MTSLVKQLRGNGSPDSNVEMQPSRNLTSRESLIDRLRRGRDARVRFVASHLSKGLAFQIRALRDRENWSQGQLADEVDTNQNAISRLESPNYGRATITSLKKIAAAFDVGLIIRFVPFSQMVDWVSGTPHLDEGLSPDSWRVPSFDEEMAMPKLGSAQSWSYRREGESQVSRRSSTSLGGSPFGCPSPEGSAMTSLAVSGN